MTLSELKEHGGHHRRDNQGIIEAQKDDQEQPIKRGILSFATDVFTFIASHLPSLCRATDAILDDIADHSGNSATCAAIKTTGAILGATEPIVQIVADKTATILQNQRRSIDPNPEITHIGDIVEEGIYTINHGILQPIIENRLTPVIGKNAARIQANALAILVENLTNEVITGVENITIEIKNFIKINLEKLIENIEFFEEIEKDIIEAVQNFIAEYTISSVTSTTTLTITENDDYILEARAQPENSDHSLLGDVLGFVQSLEGVAYDE